jgi:hypothetical protein
MQVSSTAQRFQQTAVNSSFNVIYAGLHRPRAFFVNSLFGG